MKNLMCFRKDELIIPSSSDSSEDDEADSKKQKPIKGIEDAYGIVDSLEQQLRNISSVVDGMDRRMGQNLQMIGRAVVPENYPPV